MQPSLKKLILLALVASTGLLLLQGYWLLQQWKRNTELVERQASTALKEAVNEELELRRDSLRRYLVRMLNDTSLFNFSTLYLPTQKIWSIRMADASNPKDFVNWSNKRTPVGPVLYDSVKQRIIQNMIGEYIDRNTVMFYTQKLGNKWKEQFDRLGVNEPLLNSLLQQKMAALQLPATFRLYYSDTINGKKLVAVNEKMLTLPAGIQYKSIWDIDNHFVVQAAIPDPFPVLLKRQWLSIAATFLLVLLTLYCMYRMYGIIRKQKKLAAIKNDFISNITHELKTPLATVGAAVDALQYFGGLDDEQRKEKYLNTSRQEIEKLNRLISQIMDTAIYEKESLLLNKEWIDLPALLQQEMASLSIQYGTELTYTINNLANQQRIFADRQHISSVVKNIMENAVKYHAKKDDIQLDIGISSKENNIVLEIKDNGPGIPQQYQPYLFDKFYRVPNGNLHEVKGFGLGLYYVRKIIIAHNGEVSIQSEPDKGTTVLIRLPLTHEYN